MTIPHHSSSSSSTAFPSPSLLDLLYCKEQQIDDCFRDENEEDQSEDDTVTTHQNPSFLSLLSLQHHSSDNDELQSLLVKEQQIHNNATHFDDTFRILARREAVDWILKVNTYYGFNTLTAILSINYLDRFLSLSPQFRRRDDDDDNGVIISSSSSKPWLIQLVAVTCVSLAAKVEETDVPLLLDLQIEGTKYVFEAKTIQKMELLVLSTLDWKMSSVTPVSFLDHFVKRFQMSNGTDHQHYDLHWEFYRRCERLLLTAVADSRFLRYLPSVLATSTIMHVIDHMEYPHHHHHHPVDYQNQLLRVLNITMEEVKDCYTLIHQISSPSSYSQSNNITMSRKRCHDGVVNDDDDDLLLCNEAAPPASPSGVIDAYFGSDSSNESWSSTSTSSSSTTTFSSLSTSFVHGRTAAPPPQQGGRWGKKARVYEQYMRRSSPSPTAFSSSSPFGHRRRLNVNIAAAAAGPD